MIKNGDLVYLILANTKIVERVTVVSMPRGVGDLLQVEDSDGKITAFNPYYSEFIGLQLIQESEDA